MTQSCLVCLKATVNIPSYALQFQTSRDHFSSSLCFEITVVTLVFLFCKDLLSVLTPMLVIIIIISYLVEFLVHGTC